MKRLLLILTSYLAFYQSFAQSPADNIIPMKPASALPGEYPLGVYMSATEKVAPHSWPVDAGVVLGLKPVTSNWRHAQLIIGNNPSTMMVRMKDNSNDSWSSWRKLVVESQEGKIGIGTNTPHSTLDVNGRGKFGGNAVFIDWTHEPAWNGWAEKWAGYIGFNAYRDNSDPKDHYRGTNKYTDKAVIEGSNKGFRFLLRNTTNSDSDGQHPLAEIVRFSDNGNVGIGTSAPDSKLTVKGTIHTQEVKVDLNGAVAPDYVFADDYVLPDLGETQAYIKANRHLPGIPSAAEMEEGGINLKEMNLKLLEKVEELTLHLIQQNSDKKELQEKVLALEGEIELLKQKMDKH